VYAIKTSVVDAAGNTVRVGDSQRLVIDTNSAGAGSNPGNGTGNDSNTTASFSGITLVDADLGSVDSGVSATDFITNDTSLVFKGTVGGFSSVGAAAGDRVRVQVVAADGVSVVAQQYVSPNGSGDFVFDNRASSLADGVYSLQTAVVDAAGNVVKASPVQSLVIDTSATLNPANGSGTDTNSAASFSGLTIHDPVNGSSDTGTSSSDFVTSDNTLLIKGSVSNFQSTGASAGDKVLVQILSGTTVVAQQFVTPGVGGSYVFDNRAQALADGSYTLKTAAVDAAGNVVKAGDSQVLTINGNATATALDKIQAYAVNDANPAPTAADYADAGVSGVTGTAGDPASGNLDAINSAINAQGGTDGVPGAHNSAAADDAVAVNTAAKVQAIVNAYNKVLAAADGSVADNTTGAAVPTSADYAALGVTGTTPASAALLSDVVDNKANADVDSVGELQTLADAAKAAITYTAASAQTAPTAIQINALVAGQTSGGSAVPAVTPDNAAVVQTAIAAANADGTPIASQAELAAIVKAAVTGYNDAVAKIKAYAVNDANPAPTAADYAAAGVTGVTGTAGNPASGNLDAINSAINAQGGTDGVPGAHNSAAADDATAVDSAGKVQAIVDAYKAILALANTQNDVANSANPSAAQYTAIGVTGLGATDPSSATKASLLGDVIDLKANTDVDTVGDVQTLANTVGVVIAAANGGTAPTQAQLTSLGLSGVNAQNIAAIQANIDNTANDGSGVNTLDKLQALVNNANDLPTGGVTVTGILKVGETLTASTTEAGNVLADAEGLPAASSYTYKWYADNVEISGATGSTFKLTAAQQGKAIKAQVLYTDNAAHAEAVTSSPTTAVNPAAAPGDTVIDLGTSGKLIAPVQVEGKWYYYWDRSGDGTADATDQTTHDVLDGIFKYDINGNVNPNVGTNTNDVYRYAIVNGVQLALPTANGGIAYPQGLAQYQNGTAATGQGSANNSSFDELLAIWDAYNGTGNSANTSGTPIGWLASAYWSATTSGNGHVGITYSVGFVNDYVESTNTYTALQVVGTNAAPVLNASASPSLTSVSASASAPANGNTTAGDLVSSLVAGISDADSGATQGIAITGVKAGGTLYYSLNGGTTWLTATGISDTNALLLAADGNTRVMYKSDGTQGTVSDALTFRAWDMTQHITEGVYADTTAKGGKSEFSTASDTVAVTVTAPAAGDSVISLGASGNLIAPVQVEGKWYYYWDRSGDGSNANTGSLNGGTDLVSHDTLDSIFKYDINMNERPAGMVDTNDTYRYANINGVLVALPTINGSQALPDGINSYQRGTLSGTGDSTKFDDLLAIWDTYNGKDTASGTSGTPSLWSTAAGYWSATPSVSTHARINLTSGDVSSSNISDSVDKYYVALEVVQPNAAPVLNASASPTLTSVSASASAPADGNTTAGDLLSTWITNAITDTDIGATKGIAITGVKTGGTLYYSLDGGAHWLSATGLSDTNALLLAADSNTRVMFKSDGTQGSVSDALTFRAWDMTQNITEGVYADTTACGGRSQFSTANDTVAVTVTAPAAGDSVISLGASGNLIAPVQVEGKWYYYWDRSGNGTSANTGSLNGGDDRATHDTLDSIFKYDINMVERPSGIVDTDDTYRYALLNGVLVALPTVNGGIDLPQGLNTNQNGTAATTGGTSSYDEFLAIWDTQNGTGTGATNSGVPTDWVISSYWTASKFSAQHALVATSAGTVSGASDFSTGYVALEVVKANAAPVLDAAASPALSVLQGTTAAPTNGQAVGNLVSSLVSGISDTDVGASKGIAITGFDSTNGTLYYSTNGGTTWTSVGTVSNTSALLLAADSDTRLYFAPNSNSSTTISPITFRAWDMTQHITEGVKVDTSVVNGKSEFSAVTDTIAINMVTSVVNGDGSISVGSGYGGVAGSRLGSQVSSAGDVNGDGYDDIIVSATGHSASLSSAAYVLYGNASGVMPSLTSGTVAPTQGFKITGGTYSSMGQGVSSAGDVNGDGYADILVSTLTDIGGTHATYVVYGGTTNTGVDLSGNTINSSQGFKIDIPPSTAISAAVSNAGDVNGDGYGDVLFSNSGSDTNGYTPVAYVIYGGASNASFDVTSIDSSRGFKIQGFSGNIYQTEASSAGDFNGDGYADLAFSDKAHVYVVYGGASNALLDLNASSGAITSQSGLVINASAGANIGGRMANAGDANGDGLSDLIVGAYGENAAYVVYGRTSANAINISNGTIAASDGFKVVGNTGTSFSIDVSGAGDIDGDGRADLVIGAYGTSSSAGAYHVILGGTTTITNAINASNGSAAGTANDEAIIGSAGNDTLTGGGGVDRFFAGKGNDTIVLNATDVTNLSAANGTTRETIQGGEGFDTLNVNAAGVNLNLTSITNAGAMGLEQNSRIESIERINLGADTTANTLTIAAQDVNDMAGFNNIHLGLSADGRNWTNVGAGTALSATTAFHQVVVDGTGSDNVTLAAGDGIWTNAGTVNNSVCDYTVYQNDVAHSQVLVKSGVAVTNNDPGPFTGGTISSNGVTMTLANPFVENSKTYWIVTGYSGVTPSNLAAGDSAQHDVLDTIFNNGLDTTDINRSFVSGGHTFILPTNTELIDMVLNPFPNGLYNGSYWSATLSSAGFHELVQIYNNTSTTKADTSVNSRVVVQVLPVVIDLNRDGILSYGQVTMDVNGDGLLDATKWAGAQDGVLVWDKYQDSQVHNNSQYAFAQYATQPHTNAAGNVHAATDLEGLADAFDTNHDGEFDARDAMFGQFKVWQDANQNGVSDAGEVHTLAEAGISSIHLTSDGVARTPVAGVNEAGHTTATATDGSHVLVADVGFAYTPGTATSTAQPAEAVVGPVKAASVLSLVDVLPEPDWQAHDITSAHAAYSFNSTTALTEELLHKVAA
jgi:hypothetical protein